MRKRRDLRHPGRFRERRENLPVIAVLLMTVFPTFSQEPADQTGTVIEEFSISSDAELPILPVTVGEKTYRFIPDTGCGLCVYGSSFRGRLKPSIGAPDIRINTPHGSVLRSPLESPRARLGSLNMTTEEHVICDDLDELESYLGYRMEGIIGLSFLKKQVVQIDFDRGKVLFLRQVPPDAGASFPVKLAPMGLMVLGRVGSSVSERFIIDTGFQGAGSITPAVGKQLLAEYAAVPLHSSLALDITGFSPIMNYRVSRFEIGEWVHLSDIVLSTEPTRCRLGIGTLARFIVTFDFPNQLMYVRPGERFRHPDPFRFVGFIIQRIGPRTLVAKVLSNSPAEQAGVREGDHLIEVAGQPVEGKSMRGVYRQMEGIEGEIEIKVRRTGELKTIRVRGTSSYGASPAEWAP